ncbi:hypothetical protein Tco_1320926 [Tanacetum coccineum]
MESERYLLNYLGLDCRIYWRIQVLDTAYWDSWSRGPGLFSSKILYYYKLDRSAYGVSLVWKLLRALHPKWKAKVTVIKEFKDLSSLSIDEFIRNLKVYEMVMEKDSKIIKVKKDKYKSIALKEKMESSDDETSTFGSDNEEYAMDVRDFKNSLDEVASL